MALGHIPRPATSGASGHPRPAYLDFLLSEAPPLPSTPSLHSPSSSLSSATSYTDLRSSDSQPDCTPRNLSSAFDDYCIDDTRSMRSTRSQLSLPILRLRSSASKLFRRRQASSSSIREVSPSAFSSSTGSLNSSPLRPSTSRRPSLPMLNAFSLSPSKGISALSYQPDQDKFPMQDPDPQLSSRRCYYFSARHCPGWVMGGNHGDACEQCLQAGFFGSP